jgi:hypothetical protein
MYIAIIISVLALSGFCFYMAIVSNQGRINIQLDQELMDQFAQKLAKAIVEEFMKAGISPNTRGIPFSTISGQKSSTIVDIDESIIPMSVDISDVKAENTQSMAKESIKEDSDLAESKAKLSKILKKKR